MSRALNIDATLDHVRASCTKHDAAISAIETLPGGCTRVVLCSADKAAIIKRLYKSQMIDTPVARTPLSLVARGVPMTQDLPGSRPAPQPPMSKIGRR